MTTTVLPVEKKLTKTQLKAGLIKVSLSSREHSSRLRDLLGITENTVRSYCTDVEAYEVLSVVSDGNAMLLLDAGYKTRSDTIDYLQNNMLEELITDTSEFTARALDHRVPAATYVSRKDLATQRHNPYYFDALDIASRTEWKHNNDLLNGILDGTISLSIMKSLGFGRLSKIESGLVSRALRAVTTGSTPLTQEGLGSALYRVKYSGGIASDAIQLGLIYGDSVVDVPNPSLGSKISKHIKKKYPHRGDEYEIGALTFACRMYIEGALSRVVYHASCDDYLTYYECGATPSEIVEGTVTLEQAKAIANGTPSSISSGAL